MRLDNLKIKLALTIPFGHPDRNGVRYSKEAVEIAVRNFNGKLPILYRDDDSCKDGAVVGITVGETCSVLWDDEQQVCEVIVDGKLFHGGTECIINEIKDDVVTDFSIVAVGISQ